MANPDKARGFVPVYHQNGGSWNNSLATIAMPDDGGIEEADGYFIGMPVGLADESNTAEGAGAGYPLVAPLTDEQDEINDVVYGVIVGIGRPGESGVLDQNEFGPFNPANLEGGNHLSVAEVEADADGFRLFIAPANGWVFEAQVEAASDSLTVGQGANVAVVNHEASTELGNTTTGIATAYEIVATETHPQLYVVGWPQAPDNDIELASANVHVTFVHPLGGYAEATNGIPTGTTADV